MLASRCPSPCRANSRTEATIRSKRRRLVVSMSMGVIFTLAGQGATNSAHAQGRELKYLRARTSPGTLRLIDVAAGCQAYSHVANEPAGYMLRWEGGCDKNLAEGVGIRRLMAAGQPLSTELGRYERGSWVHVDERYTLTMGRIIRSMPSPDAAPGDLLRDRKVDAREVPSWAQDIVSAQPVAHKAWDEDVVMRLAEVAQINARQGKSIGGEKEDRELLFGPEDDHRAPAEVVNEGH